MSIEKKEQKRIDAHEKNIENSMQKIWKYEQKMIKDDLSEDKKEKLQQKINQELLLIEEQENLIENPGFTLQTE
ncbi:hypothetical protein JEOAER750_01029 [Jeotgalicoccus aerolatus]|uniref:Na+/phosphate symporter n=1 Tax=Jeotgalicoccus aerolatus TaxID=709510 RepID=A0ABS4HM65_9STAP|nr:hypothetical protein [Jeotgalicoccus aerolatus]MBP1951913.1 Na+/phosphate symporter [Jeotgalicoccus aerolatus]GGD93775.1 hypothetical protein GCM10007273_02630 [Jeotgalicoccus aerolatus]CAD2074875.1 hypothetical protein JEOAER750_01029 [Jeotgalicoccus aerolatus]